MNNTLVSIIQWTHSYKYFQKHAVKPWKQSWINNVNSILIQFCIITLLESEEFFKANISNTLNNTNIIANWLSKFKLFHGFERSHNWGLNFFLTTVNFSRVLFKKYFYKKEWFLMQWPLASLHIHQDNFFFLR